MSSFAKVTFLMVFSAQSGELVAKSAECLFRQLASSRTKRAVSFLPPCTFQLVRESFHWACAEASSPMPWVNLKRIK